MGPTWRFLRENVATPGRGCRGACPGPRAPRVPRATCPGLRRARRRLEGPRPSPPPRRLCWAPPARPRLCPPGTRRCAPNGPGDAGDGHGHDCSVLFCSVLFCSVLFCSVLFCSVLFRSVLFCSVLSVLFCFCFWDTREKLTVTLAVWTIWSHWTKGFSLKPSL